MGRSTSSPFGADDDLVAPREHDRRGQVADAELRPLEVGDEREWATPVALDAPSAGGHFRMLGLCAVREVQPGGIHARGNELLDEPGRGRAERRDDLRPARDLGGHLASVSRRATATAESRGNALQPG